MQPFGFVRAMVRSTPPPEDASGESVWSRARRETALWANEKGVRFGLICALPVTVLGFVATSATLHQRWPVRLAADVGAVVVGFLIAVGLLLLIEWAVVSPRRQLADARRQAVAQAVTDSKAAEIESVARRMELGRHIDSLLSFYTDTDFDGLFGASGAPRSDWMTHQSGDAIRQANEWENSTYASLRRIGQIHAARFRNDIGVPADMAKEDNAFAPLGVIETRKMVRRRLHRLNEISRDLERR